MKTAFRIILSVIAIVWGLGTRIEFKPFRIHFDSWESFIGLICIIIGVAIISHSDYKKGVKDGQEIVIEALVESAQQKADEPK